MRVTLKIRFMTLSLVIVAVLLFTGAISYYSTKKIITGNQSLLTFAGARKDAAMDARIALGSAVHAVKDFIIRRDPPSIDRFKEETSSVEKSIRKVLEASQEAADRAAAQKALDLLAEYQGKNRELFSASGRPEELGAASEGIERPLADALKGLETSSEKSFQEGTDSLTRFSIRLLWIEVAAVLIAAVSIGLFTAHAGRWITWRLARFSEVIQKVAQNDLTVRVIIRADDELGDMGKYFNSMIDANSQLIENIRDSALHVASASDQLHGTAEQLAAGAEQVAAQTSAVATAGEEMAATSTEIAQNCSRAAHGSVAAGEAARAGSGVVEQTVQVMSRIAERVTGAARTVSGLGERSEQIGQIIGTIEDIADQTNLLALNAAIEAARAGEQGRGFAVVADEVRALAERTTRATREISEMIKAIQQETRTAVSSMQEGVDEVTSGTADAARSGEALCQILAEIDAVTTQVSQIATAAEEQTATTGEISRNIVEVTDVVRSTAGSAHETADAAGRLSRVAEELELQVERFKLA